MDRKEVMNEIYNSALATTGAVLVSMAAKKVGVQLGTPELLKGTAKLAVSVAAGSLMVKYLLDMKYLPVDSFKSA